MPMGARRHSGFVRTAIRRVIRRGHEFVCGVCRQAHAHPAEANACLRQCWAEHTAIPVDSFRASTGTRWRCRHCSRDYTLKEQAEDCASECSGKLRISFYSLSEGSDGLAPKAQVITPRRKLSIVPTAPRSASKSSNRPQQTQQEDGDAPASTVSADITATPAAQETTDAGGGEQPKAGSTHPPKDPNKKFFRDGARYVCMVCSAKYFTKMEVEACWKGHP